MSQGLPRPCNSGKIIANKQLKKTVYAPAPSIKRIGKRESIVTVFGQESRCNVWYDVNVKHRVGAVGADSTSWVCDLQCIAFGDSCTGLVPCNFWSRGISEAEVWFPSKQPIPYRKLVLLCQADFKKGGTRLWVLFVLHTIQWFWELRVHCCLHLGLFIAAKCKKGWNVKWH